MRDRRSPCGTSRVALCRSAGRRRAVARPAGGVGPRRCRPETGLPARVGRKRGPRRRRGSGVVVGCRAQRALTSRGDVRKVDGAIKAALGSEQPRDRASHAGDRRDARRPVLARGSYPTDDRCPQQAGTSQGAEQRVVAVECFAGHDNGPYGCLKLRGGDDRPAPKLVGRHLSDVHSVYRLEACVAKRRLLAGSRLGRRDRRRGRAGTACRQQHAGQCRDGCHRCQPRPVSQGADVRRAGGCGGSPSAAYELACGGRRASGKGNLGRTNQSSGTGSLRSVCLSYLPRLHMAPISPVADQFGERSQQSPLALPDHATRAKPALA